MDFNDDRHPRFDAKYKHLPIEVLPSAESLKDAIERVIPVWSEEIAPMIKLGQNVLVVSHLNTLRGLMKHIQGLTI